MSIRGALVGGTIGGIDAALGGESIGWGIASGAAFGAVLGAAAALFPAVFSSSYFLGFGMGFAIPSIVSSFQQGKTAQGAFRVFTGIFIPIALRNAAIARLAAASEEALMAKIATLWKNIPLRTNAYGLEPGVAGSYVNQRIRLSPETPPGRYLYVVDEEGRIWLGPQNDTVKHSSLVPPGAKVRSAGHVAVKTDGSLTLNCRSGHYMAETPIMPAEEPSWLAAMAEIVLASGLVPKDLYPGGTFFTD